MRARLFPASGQPFPNVLKFSWAQRSSDTDVSLWWCLVIIRPNYGSPPLVTWQVGLHVKGMGGMGLAGSLCVFKWALLCWGVSHGPQQIATVDTSELWDCKSPTEAWSGSNTGQITVTQALRWENRVSGMRRRRVLSHVIFKQAHRVSGRIINCIAILDHYLQREHRVMLEFRCASTKTCLFLYGN